MAHRRKSPTRFGWLALGLVAALLGCGGERARVDAAQAYRDEVALQCRDGRLDRDAVPRPVPLTAGRLARYLQANAAIARRYERQAQRLRPPPELRDEHAEARRLGGESIALLEQAARRARAGADPDAVLRRLERPLNARIGQGNRLARRLGLGPCEQERLDARS